MTRQDYRLAIENAWVELAGTSTQHKPGARYQVFNISRGGLRFSSNELFDSQERMNITLHLPNNDEHLALGRICYCEPSENSNVLFYGVSFLENFLNMLQFQKPS